MSNVEYCNIIRCCSIVNKCKVIMYMIDTTCVKFATCLLMSCVSCGIMNDF